MKINDIDEGLFEAICCVLDENYHNYRSISDIAGEIAKDWHSVYYAAKPYLTAMHSLDKMEDNYGQDSAQSVVSYFLSNASQWKGETAKRIKLELKAMLQGKPVAAVNEEFELDEATKYHCSNPKCSAKLTVHVPGAKPIEKKCSGCGGEWVKSNRTVKEEELSEEEQIAELEAAELRTMVAEAGSALAVFKGLKELPPSKEWENRHEVTSRSSGRKYVVARNASNGTYGCSCPGWTKHAPVNGRRKACKHLTALGLD
jgi:hypothetical protein